MSERAPPGALGPAGSAGACFAPESAPARAWGPRRGEPRADAGALAPARRGGGLPAARTPVTLRAASDGSDATREAAARRASRPGDERPAAMASTSAPSSSSSSVASEPRARPDATESASWSLRTEPDRALLNLAEGRSPTETRAALLGREAEACGAPVPLLVAITGSVGSEPPGAKPLTRATGRDAPVAVLLCTGTTRPAGAAAAQAEANAGAADCAERASVAAERACTAPDCDVCAERTFYDAVRARAGRRARGRCRETLAVGCRSALRGPGSRRCTSHPGSDHARRRTVARNNTARVRPRLPGSRCCWTRPGQRWHPAGKGSSHLACAAWAGLPSQAAAATSEAATGFPRRRGRGLLARSWRCQAGPCAFGLVRSFRWHQHSLCPGQRAQGPRTRATQRCGAWAQFRVQRAALCAGGREPCGWLSGWGSRQGRGRSEHARVTASKQASKQASCYHSDAQLQGAGA